MKIKFNYEDSPKCNNPSSVVTLEAENLRDISNLQYLVFHWQLIEDIVHQKVGEELELIHLGRKQKEIKSAVEEVFEMTRPPSYRKQPTCLTCEHSTINPRDFQEGVHCKLFEFHVFSEHVCDDYKEEKA